MTTTVRVYLPVQPEGVTPTTEFIHALSVPLQDIKRLTTRPLKWLRFATFTVCGAKGDLSATQGGKRVDYESVTFDNIADTYYYKPDDMYHLVDLEAFNEQITSSEATSRRSEFREDVCRRDDTCAITGARRERCDAAHIIPYNKGSDYITHLMNDRSSLYEQPLFGPLEGIVDINNVQNGILLRKDLHESFGNARTVFLRTPNFAMDSADVPRIEEGPIPPTRTTLQYMEPSTELDPVLPRDVRADWSSGSAPPSILLDFMYGAAVVKHWGCDRLSDMLDEWHKDDFSNIPKYPKDSTSEAEDEDEEPRTPTEREDLPRGDSERLPGRGKPKVRKTFSSDAKARVLDAMDDVLYLSMLVRGITPQGVAAEREKRQKENELRSQERSIEKVQQWLALPRPS